jgi:biotin synthase
MAKEMSISDKIERLLLKVETAADLTRDDIVGLLRLPGDYSQDIFSAADRICRQHTGNDVFLRGIIEFSNYCNCNCLYCGLRKGNKKLSRYRMSDDEIIATAEQINKTGIPTVVLQSGEDSFYSSEKICRLIERIQRETNSIITLSIGERPVEDYKEFKQAGADRYLLKHETASPELYKYLRPGCQQDKRIQCLRSLKHLGFETGTGNMVGLPGQTLEILADDLLLMKILDADMLGIGPFISHPDTPLAGIENDDIELTLRVLAVARLLTRNTNIPATTALATLHPQGRLMALNAGANVVMPDFTPEIYKSRYDIYPGKTDSGSPTEIIENLKTDIHSIGKNLNFSIGNRASRQYQGIIH